MSWYLARCPVHPYGKCNFAIVSFLAGRRVRNVKEGMKELVLFENNFCLKTIFMMHTSMIWEYFLFGLSCPFPFDPFVQEMFYCYARFCMVVDSTAGIEPICPLSSLALALTVAPPYFSARTVSSSTGIGNTSACAAESDRHKTKTTIERGEQSQHELMMNWCLWTHNS